MKEDEIRRVMERYGTGLYRLCRTMLGRDMDAEDAVSETIIRYFQKAPQFVGPEQEKAWLFTVAANICRDMLRKRKRLVSLDDLELPESVVEPKDREILEALGRLPERYRTVIYLTYVEGYKSHEIASMLGISPQAVRKRLQKGRSLLKLEYEKE